MLKKIVILFYFILLFVGYIYTVRLLLLSKFLAIKVKIGATSEMWIHQVFYLLLFIFSIVYITISSSTTKYKYILVATGIIVIIIFMYGRYSGIFLTFEEYINK